MINSKFSAKLHIFSLDPLFFSHNLNISYYFNINSDFFVGFRENY